MIEKIPTNFRKIIKTILLSSLLALFPLTAKTQEDIEKERYAEPEELPVNPNQEKKNKEKFWREIEDQTKKEMEEFIHKWQNKPIDEETGLQLQNDLIEKLFKIINKFEEYYRKQNREVPFEELDKLIDMLEEESNKATNKLNEKNQNINNTLIIEFFHQQRPWKISVESGPPA